MKKKKTQPDDNRLVKAGWNVYQSVDLSMRVLPQKNMEIYFPAAFRYVRENGKRHRVCWTFVTRLFFFPLFFFLFNPLFSMLWIHRVLYRSRLFETTHLRKDRSSVDMISFPFSFFSRFLFLSIRYPATNARVHGFVRKYIWFPLS